MDASEVRSLEDRALDQPKPRRMLNEKQVLEIIPVSRTTLYRMETSGKFPKSTYISPNRRVWFEDEIVHWQNTVDERDPRRGRGQGRRRRVSTSPAQHGADERTLPTTPARQ
jgi:predicted DNA-binding transcriptional regulator AlpA